MDVIVIIACYYFAFTEIKSLVDYGAAPWRIEHYILAAISLALLVLGTLRAIQSYKTWKYKKDHPEEEMMSQVQNFQQEEDTTPTLQNPGEDDAKSAEENDAAAPEAAETTDEEKPL
ncbi:MAG: hypothetical protein PWQ08_1149 [Clostridiales bacterium]|nr:hypothetical protein [Clostridiales bacterium]